VGEALAEAEAGSLALPEALPEAFWKETEGEMVPVGDGDPRWGAVPNHNEAIFFFFFFFTS